jgi:acetyltransferase-like isoleucine patch superfamily enzyme
VADRPSAVEDVGLTRVRRPQSLLYAYQRGRDIRDRLTTRAFAPSFAHLGKGSRFALPVEIVNPQAIWIGDGVYLGPGCLLWTEGDELTLEIGDGTGATGYCVFSACSRVRIGPSVLMGRGVHITDHNHGRADPAAPIIAQALDDVAPVEIGAGAWLGDNVMVLPGVTIGRGAVVGANSVVTEDLPERVVAVGAPARVVSRLDTP